MIKNKIRVLLLVLLISLLAVNIAACGKPKAPETVKDEIFRLIVPEGWEMEIGESRMVDYAFVQGTTDRRLSWSTTDSLVATVDEWGRVTAVGTGNCYVTATPSADGTNRMAKLRVRPEASTFDNSKSVVYYSGNSVSLGDNLQKLVTRKALNEEGVPTAVSSIADYTTYQSATTADGAVWTITDYGVLRTDDDATNPRDVEQRFMGDRYFYSVDTTTGKVLGIVADGSNGIWTIMADGYTHIEMVAINGIDKATRMNETTEEYVMRRGMVSEAYLQSDGSWKPNESDNDGLWTSMYAAGELMRYAVLKNDPTATAEEIQAAKDSAYISTEAVLLLSNLCMRTGTVEAYIRYQPNGKYDETGYNGRWLSEEALVKGGDYSINIPYESPTDIFKKTHEAYVVDGMDVYFMNEDFLTPYDEDSWSDPRDGEGEYATITRTIEGFIARTYSFKDEGNLADGYIHWAFTDEDTAIGTSSKSENDFGYYLNGTDMRGLEVDASGEIPARLWNDLIGEGYSVDDIIYKGDTSSDEIIGHLFLYKLAYDIIGAEDNEIKNIISNTMDRFAKHIVANGYMMVDGAGQPGTWSKFNRAFFYNTSQLGGAPLTASVVLSLFKVAAYVTGDQRWENEYRMAALDPSYEYAELMSLYAEQCEMYMLMLAGGIEVDIGGTMTNVGFLLEDIIHNDLGSPLTELLNRLFLNYSDEEMAMLAFYILFQLEEDEEILKFYREAIDDWWVSIKYSENPLWYYIYQLAYPDKTITDAFGNNILETAAWSLSRHPIDTRRYNASNGNRDDVKEFSLRAYGLNEGSTLCYDISEEDALADVKGGDILGLVGALLDIAPTLPWAVAAPDERAMHKYNGNSYELDSSNPYEMEGATTYTLPFWMGIYHKMLTVD